MKRKLSKILGVGLTLALLTSLLLVAAPVSADVSQPTVTLAKGPSTTNPKEVISKINEYSITFSITEELAIAGGPDYIEVRFPEDTDIDNFDSVDWIAANAYVVGDVVHDTTYNGRTYRVTTAGTSGGAEPAWDTLDVGVTITDNTVTWTTVTSITIAATSGIGSESFFGKFPVAAATVDTDDLTVQFDLPATTFNSTNTIGVMASVQVVLDGVINPTEPGDYTLEVKTEEETTYVTSATYEIEVPTLGGGVYVYNEAGVQMDFLGGATALDDARIAGYFAMDDFTITLGPGTYLLTQDIIITGDDFTFNSSDGADVTEIDANESYGIIINSGTAGDTTIEDLTINDANIAITINGDDAVIRNNVIKDADGPGPGILIQAGGTNATIADNVFYANKIAAIQFEAQGSLTDMDDIDITGNEIEEGDSDAPGILFSGGNQNIDITGNTISANEGSGIEIVGSTKIDDVLIKGNTISANEGHGIDIDTAAAPTKLEISENDIVDNAKSGRDGIRIDQSGTGVWDVTNTIVFNNFSGNGSDAIQNNSDDDVNAYLNWWGSAVEDDFDGDIEEGGDGDINYEPWLTAEFPTSLSAGDVKANTSSLDGKDDVGVSVTGMEDDDPTDNAEIIIIGKYVANPEDAIDDAIAFYDVLVVLETTVVLDEVTARLKFYDSAITTGSVVSFWTGDFWAEASNQLARNGIIWVTIDEDTIPTFEDLEGTAFVVVAGEAVTEFGAPMLIAPDGGAADISLTPTFAWTGVAGADGYYFQFADNANFVVPLVKLEGDLGRLIVTAYAYVTELPYSTAYYWRVKAVSGTIEAGNLDESEWVSSVFITMDEPVEPADIILEPADIILEQPDIVIELPDIIVPIPAETPITPGWIYVIIAVGGVLVIALIVLIVRTRRVA